MSAAKRLRIVLGSLTGLESLILKRYCSGDVENDYIAEEERDYGYTTSEWLDIVLQGHDWKSLRELALSEFRVHGANLADTLTRHASTLRTVHLAKCMLSSYEDTLILLQSMRYKLSLENCDLTIACEDGDTDIPPELEDIIYDYCEDGFEEL